MARTGLSRDSLDRERRGRIIGEDQHKGAIRARARELMRMDIGRGGGGRAASPTPAPSTRFSGGKGASREAVLKVIAWTKDSASPMAQAKYASRTRQSDPPEGGLLMVNEEGCALRGARGRGGNHVMGIEAGGREPVARRSAGHAGRTTGNAGGGASTEAPGGAHDFQRAGALDGGFSAPRPRGRPCAWGDGSGRRIPVRVCDPHGP